MIRHFAIAMLLAGAAPVTAMDVKGVVPGMSIGEAKAILPNLDCNPFTIPGKRMAADTLCETGARYANDYADVSLWVKNGRVARVTVRGKNGNWSAVREGLIAKYGRPTSMETPRVTFGSGATVNSETLAWRIGDQTLKAYMHANAIDFGVALTVDWFDAEERSVSGAPGKDM